MNEDNWNYITFTVYLTIFHKKPTRFLMYVLEIICIIIKSYFMV